MEGRQRVAEGRKTRARGDGVKTKNGCEDVFSAQISLPKGIVNKYFSENSSDLSDNFLPSRREKSQITRWLEAPDPGYNELWDSSELKAVNSHNWNRWTARVSQLKLGTVEYHNWNWEL